MADGNLIAGTAADGFPVAECEIAPGEVGLLPALIGEAAAFGASRLWVRSAADLTADGFTAVEGYRRFAIGSCPAGMPLPVLDAETVAALWPRAFAGQRGHKLVDAATAREIAAGPDLGRAGGTVPGSRLLDRGRDPPAGKWSCAADHGVVRPSGRTGRGISFAPGGRRGQ